MSQKNLASTPSEVLQIIKHLKCVHGDTLTIHLIRVRQQNSLTLFTSSIPVSLSNIIFQKVPRNQNNPKGINRALVSKKLNDIEASAGDNDYSLPNSVVGSIVSNRVWGMELDYNKNDKLGFLHIKLSELEKRVQAAELDKNGNFVAPEEFMLGYLIDSHHRLLGLYKADRPDYELPTSIYLDINDIKMHQIFSTINENQSKTSRVHNLYSKYLGNTLLPQEKNCVFVLEDLNNQEESILYKRIKLFDDVPKDSILKKYKKTAEHSESDIKPYVNSNIIQKLIIDNVFEAVPYAKLETDDLVKLINNYFHAFAEVFPEAWADSKTHVLVKSMGFQITMKVFKDIYNKVHIKNAEVIDIPTKLQFKVVIQALLRPNPKEFLDLDVYSNGIITTTIPLNWSSLKFGSYSNGKGINSLTSSIKQLISNNSSNL
ncbi:DGQHR domain-containing protein [Priestia megaterium]|uniref:DGQHR domain-containing protein n=1 Tax=Priestia megaterium TaxID=1404 RepID=UPI0021D65E56|nr:DGQHR domain-containing protein [Priestia megaterium]MCU7741036.1 DGQHR domain-containing protein [Priestia megaterium]MCU7746432.1 DGQHR domain-containing protein [Priestia megaterium]